jgi:hypothetical protein
MPLFRRSAGACSRGPPCSSRSREASSDLRLFLLALNNAYPHEYVHPFHTQLEMFSDHANDRVFRNFIRCGMISTTGSMVTALGDDNAGEASLKDAESLVP